MTHIDGEADYYLDVISMDAFEDNSQDASVCTYVLEHVEDIKLTVGEIHRTLKPGGAVLASIPFLYPYHDVVDFWRTSCDGILSLFQGFEIHSLTRLGGTLSTVANLLQRPKGKVSPRFMVYKSIGLMAGILGRRLNAKDGAPIGYGVYATKK